MDEARNGTVDPALVEALFLEAMELSTAERTALLDERCGDDLALREEVESLLAGHDQVGLLPEMEGERAFGGRWPERIAGYRIVRPLGEGGMGVVLLAIREGPGFEQTVALKLIRGSFVDPLLARRLEEERRILALLEHPGIARLVDGGVTPEGQPYYAMEYVRGEDLLSWCDARRLPLEERLRLFLQVCEAVHHAHQQLVVHRDLKPSNILVTPEGLPKLLDFGIAKNLESVGSGEQTAPWVTPAYASPEQLGRGVVTTLSDVWALGVLLCELVAGARPHDTAGASPAELARRIAEEPPRRPSDLVGRTEAGAASAEETAGRRGRTPARLARDLRGDLDLIVLKALAGEPQRRYGTAWELAEDLRRFLDGRPVHARPDSVGYRVGKFVRRHRGMVSVAALLALALLGGAGGILWQARMAADQRDRAEAEAARARQVTALMTDIFRLGDPTQALGDTIGVRQVLEEGSRRVDEALGDDPVLQATLFLELARIYRNLGILGEAERLGARSLALRSIHEAGTVAEADGLGFQGLVLRDLGRPREAVAHLERAILLRERLLPAPDTALASLLAGLGWEVRSAGDHERASQLFGRALEIQRRHLGEDAPAVATSMLGLAATSHDLGSFDEAEALFRSALGPGRAAASPVAAAALVNLGMVRRLREQFGDAEPLLRAGLEMRLALFDGDHPDVVEAREQLAIDLAQLGRFSEAERLFEEGLAVARRTLGMEHERTRGLLEASAVLDHDLGRFERAGARMDSVVALKRVAHGGDHPGVVFSLNAAADALLDGGREEAAEARYREALAMGARLGGNEGVYGALSRNGLARVALTRGQVPLADSLSAEALTLMTAELRPDHRYVLEVQRTRAAVALARGRPADALRILGPLLAGEEKTRPDPHPRRGAALELIGDAHAAAGDDQKAVRAWRDALAQLSALSPGHPARERLGRKLAAGG